MIRSLVHPKTLLWFALAAVFMTLVFRLAIGQHWLAAVAGGVVTGLFIGAAQALGHRRSVAG